MVLPFLQIMRDFVTDGVPSSGEWEPKKSEMRSWGTWVENALGSIGVNSGTIYSTRALLYADLSKPANTLAWVNQDPTAAYNGIYRKVGTSGAGSWDRTADLPYSFVNLTDTGAGTANAIQLASSTPTSVSALRVANVLEANTGAVTISENGEAAKPLLTSAGNPISPGGLTAGSMIVYVDSGTSYRLLSDQASAAIVAAVEGLLVDAEAARDAAADYADFARNNWSVMGPFMGTGEQEDYLLSIDPGTVNNMFVIVGGVGQLTGAYELVHSAGSAFIRINVPDDVPFEVRVSNSIPVGTPADGSVTTAKHANNSVTFAKMQDIATLRLLGRVAAGSGDPGELTAAELRDFFLPAGSVVDSAYHESSSSAEISAVIPFDGSPPQIGEGTQINSVTITPKSLTNKLRIKWSGCASASALTTMIAAVFSSLSANALNWTFQVEPTAGYLMTFSLQAEFTPATLSAVTISVRAGPQGGTMRFNHNTVSATGLGSKSVLVVEEIKGA